jgi:hypothetical protein
MKRECEGARPKEMNLRRDNAPFGNRIVKLLHPRRDLTVEQPATLVTAVHDVVGRNNLKHVFDRQDRDSGHVAEAFAVRVARL